MIIISVHFFHDFWIFLGANLATLPAKREKGLGTGKRFLSCAPSAVLFQVNQSDHSFSMVIGLTSHRNVTAPLLLRPDPPPQLKKFLKVVVMLIGVNSQTARHPHQL